MTEEQEFDKLIDVKILAGSLWLTSGASCKGKYEECDFAQYFNRDPEGYLELKMYYFEAKELYDQLHSIFYNEPINTKQEGQQSLKEFEE